MFEVIRNITVPTGNILILNGEYGPLECLSIGDYGKDVNLTERPVEHVGIMQLSEKWVVTISSQYGCSIGCKFCDVPKVGPGRNASYADMRGQVRRAMELHPDALDGVEKGKRLNVHFARMGEPTFNPDVLTAARWLRAEYGHSFETVHPVVSTMMPRNNAWLYEFLQAWMQIKNFHYWGEAGLQLSINSTSDSEREEGIVDTNPRTCPDPVYTSQVIYWFALWAEFGYKEAAGDEAAKRRQTRERGQLA